MKKQNKDISLDEVLFFHVEKMMKQSKSATVALFKKHKIDLTKDQWVILKAISDRSGQTQVELSDWTDRDPASIKRTLDILLNKALIQKTVSATDSKALCIFLSKKGQRLVGKTTPLVQQLRATAFQKITKKDLKTAMEVMVKIKENFKN